MLLILLALAVATVMLGVRSHLAVRITVGLLLVPPVLLKLASVTWRMLSYHVAVRGLARRRPHLPPSARLAGSAVITSLLLGAVLAVILAGRAAHYPR